MKHPHRLTFVFAIVLSSAAQAGEVRIEAETGTVSGGAVIVRDEPAASKGGCIASMHERAANCTIKDVEGFSGGPAEIVLGYASHGDGGRLRIKVNGKDVADLFCPSTGGWNKFVGRVSFVAELQPGPVNTIEFLGGRGGVNLDYIEVYPKAPATPALARLKRDACFIAPGDVVLLIGDSVTADGRYAARAIAQMRSRYPELSGVRILNASFPGATAETVSDRLDGLVGGQAATVAVVCLGLNDVLTGKSEKALERIRVIVRRLSTRKIATTLLSPPAPQPAGRAELLPIAEKLARFAEELSKVAQEEGAAFADCYSAMRRAADAGEDFTWGDGLRPNERGHQMMADALLQAWKFGRTLARSVGDQTP